VATPIDKNEFDLLDFSSGIVEQPSCDLGRAQAPRYRRGFFFGAREWGSHGALARWCH
jgi:hypothetical protein